jgi:hypothetical protein
MTLRNMPLPIVEILFDEIRNYQGCDSCGEVRLCERRSDYIADVLEGDDCDSCHYYLFYHELGRNKGPKMGVTYTSKVTNICHECLAEFNDDKLEEMDKYK